MSVPDRLRRYLSILMQSLFFYHSDLDKIELIFLLEPTEGTIKERCRKYADLISDEDFPKLAEYLLNKDTHSEEVARMKEAFCRALELYGFSVEIDEGGNYRVSPKFLPKRLEETKEEIKTLLNELGFKAVQGSLDIAEDQYVKGEYAKSLWNSRKALEDLLKLLARRLNIENKELLNKYVKSKHARTVINKVRYFVCKGHEVEAPEADAIFGYHLVLSVIYYLLLLFKKRQNSNYQ